MDNNRMKFGYKDTDKKIEIELYGIVFEIDLNKEKIDKLKEIKNEISLEEMEKYIDSILGENAVQKINEKRKQDGYKKINEDIALQIFMCIFQAYGNNYIGNITKYIEKSNNNIEKQYNRFNKNINRYKRNYRRY